MTSYSELLTHRAQMYRFLSRAYRSELDQPALDAVRALTFPYDPGVPALAEGYQALRDWLADPGPDPLTALAVDFARVFLGAGVTEGPVAFPCESVYTSPEQLMMQDAWEEVRSLYREAGLGRGESSLPEDHISMECEFMALLGERSFDLFFDPAQLRQLYCNLTDQGYFLRRHLLNWVGRFTAGIQLCPCGPFYRAIAQITDGFFACERAQLPNLDAGLLPEPMSYGDPEERPDITF